MGCSCENIVLWRGHFNATGSETSVNLSINGGQAFAASVFLNQHFIGTAYGKYVVIVLEAGPLRRRS